MNFEELVEYAKRNKCSDIHITVGTNLAIRRYGSLEILEPAPTAEEYAFTTVTTCLIS